MKRLIFFALLFCSFASFGQTWNEVNSNVKVIPQPSYDSTFVLSAPSRSALAQGQASWTSARSYKVYTALVSQSGTDAPVATVLENTLGGTVVWSYVSPGIYRATLEGAFNGSITAVFIQYTLVDSGGVAWDQDNSGIDFIQIFSESGNDALMGTPFEIRVYNP